MNSQASKDESLEQQVLKLQREIRFLKRWVLVAAGGLLVAIVALRNSGEHRVEMPQAVAKDFALIDSESRAQLRFAGFGARSEQRPEERLEIECGDPFEGTLDGLRLQQHAGNIVVLRSVAHE
jgi:hypothetical protein